MSALTSFDAFVLSTRRCGALPLLLRAITAVATTGAIVATVVPSWDVPDLYVIVAALAALAGLVVPDSGAGAVAAVAIVVAWATGSPDGVGPAVVVTALCLLVAHVTAAQSAAMPVTAAGSTRLVWRWARPTVALGGATLAAVLVLSLLEGWSPPGSIVVVVATLAVVAAGAWLLTATGQRPRGR